MNSAERADEVAALDLRTRPRSTWETEAWNFIRS